MNQTDENYIWPRTLRMPVRAPKLVYLDLNHWIALAKALSGHHNGKTNIALLDFCLRAVERKIAIFPISLSGNIHKYDDICLVSLSTVR